MSPTKSFFTKPTFNGTLSAVDMPNGLHISGMTVQQMREAVQNNRIGYFGSKTETPAKELLDIANLAIRGIKEAVAFGRVFDFGWLPNSVIIPESVRASKLLKDGHIHMPFADWFIVRHEWEELTSFYAVFQSNGPEEPLSVEIAELSPFRHGARELFVGVETMGSFLIGNGMEGYSAVIDANPLMVATLAERGIGAEQAMADIAAGMINPVVAALGVLHTDNVPVTKIDSSSKLNRARVKSGKLPIPPYYKVHAEGYVTALLHKGQRGTHAPGDGGRSSPVAHVRRGHERHLANGTTVWVRDALINFRATGEVLTRAGYRVGGVAP